MNRLLVTTFAAVSSLIALSAVVWATASAPDGGAHPTAALAWAELHCDHGTDAGPVHRPIDRERLLEDQQVLDRAAKAFGVDAVCAHTSRQSRPLIDITLSMFMAPANR